MVLFFKSERSYICAMDKIMDFIKDFDSNKRTGWHYLVGFFSFLFMSYLALKLGIATIAFLTFFCASVVIPIGFVGHLLRRRNK